MKLLIIPFLIINTCLGQIKTFETVYKQLTIPDTLNETERIQVIFSNPDFFPALIDCEAPDFELETISGERFKLADLKEKVVLLDFWSITCKPCIVQLPAFNKLINEFKDKQVVFIAIASNTKQELESFLTHHVLNMPLAEKNKVIMDMYFAHGYPLTFIIDRHGIVKKVWLGGTTDKNAATKAYEKIKGGINECLKE